MAAWSGGAPLTTWHDRAWVRSEMAAWDERFAALSAGARRAFVEDVRAPARPDSPPPRTGAAKLPPGAVEELVAAGLVEVAAGARGGTVSVPAAACGLAARLRALRRYRLLRDGGPGALRNYASHAFDSYWLRQYLAEVVEKATGQRVLYQEGDVLEAFVPQAPWPEWVASWLNAPLAAAVLEAIDQAGGQLPITAVAGRVSGAAPAEVRGAIDRLVTYLALVEDLHPETYEVMVGLLPAVRAARERRAAPAALPDPVAPAEVAPEGGVEVPDLLALLLELVAQPARLRQDGTVYARELPRLAATLPALPAWLAGERVEPESRVDRRLYLAGRLGLVQRGANSDGDWLEVSPAGQEWLAGPAEKKYATVYAAFRESRRDPFSFGDPLFLGCTVFAVAAGRRGRSSLDQFFSPTDEDRQPLRQALRRALMALPEGAFYPVGPLLDYLARGPRNPLWLGATPGAVRVWYQERPVPPVEDVLEAAARGLLGDLITKRLGPLGAVQLGIDEGGGLLVARHRRLGAYFGEAVAEAPVGPTRVVVQPDFSVVVIGPGAGPAVALAPFCDRARGQAGAALTFKLTRDSVVRALAAGLSPEEVLARLEQYASTGVPANVRAQVQSWAGRVRTVRASTVELLRCPDADTARRVREVLGKKAEAVGEAMVALPGGTLSGALRQKLRAAGLLVTDGEV